MKLWLLGMIDYMSRLLSGTKGVIGRAANMLRQEGRKLMGPVISSLDKLTEWYKKLCEKGHRLSDECPALTYLANALSYLRVFSTALLVIAIWQGWLESTAWSTAIVWLLIAFTDALDGQAARIFRGRPNGAKVDERADKASINIVLIALAVIGQVPLYFVAIMALRDILVTWIRYRAERKGNDAVKSAKILGKTKTALQCTLIAVALLPFYSWQLDAVLVLSAVAAIMSIMSGIQIYLLSIDATDPASEWLKGTGGKMGVPNWFSSFRLSIGVLLPYMFLCRPLGIISDLAGIITMAFAMATDAVDGLIARKTGQKTNAGEMLDPASDRMIFYPSAITLIILYSNELILQLPQIGEWNMKYVFIALGLPIALRDLSFTVGYLWFLMKNSRNKLASTMTDKIRFWSQCTWLVAAGLAFLFPASMVGWVHYFFEVVFLAGLFVAAVLSIVTIVERLAGGRKH